MKDESSGNKSKKSDSSKMSNNSAVSHVSSQSAMSNISALSTDDDIKKSAARWGWIAGKQHTTSADDEQPESATVEDDAKNEEAASSVTTDPVDAVSPAIDDDDETDTKDGSANQAEETPESNTSPRRRIWGLRTNSDTDNSKDSNESNNSEPKRRRWGLLGGESASAQPQEDEEIGPKDDEIPENKLENNVAATASSEEKQEQKSVNTEEELHAPVTTTNNDNATNRRRWGLRIGRAQSDTSSDPITPPTNPNETDKLALQTNDKNISIEDDVSSNSLSETSDLEQQTTTQKTSELDESSISNSKSSQGELSISCHDESSCKISEHESVTKGKNVSQSNIENKQPSIESEPSPLKNEPVDTDTGSESSRSEGASKLATFQNSSDDDLHDDDSSHDMRTEESSRASEKENKCVANNLEASSQSSHDGPTFSPGFSGSPEQSESDLSKESINSQENGEGLHDTADESQQHETSKIDSQRSAHAIENTSARCPSPAASVASDSGSYDISSSSSEGTLSQHDDLKNIEPTNDVHEDGKELEEPKTSSNFDRQSSWLGTTSPPGCKNDSPTKEKKESDTIDVADSRRGGFQRQLSGMFGILQEEDLQPEVSEISPERRSDLTRQLSGMFGLTQEDEKEDVPSTKNNEKVPNPGGDLTRQLSGIFGLSQEEAVPPTENSEEIPERRGDLTRQLSGIFTLSQVAQDDDKSQGSGMSTKSKTLPKRDDFQRQLSGLFGLSTDDDIQSDSSSSCDSKPELNSYSPEVSQEQQNTVTEKKNEPDTLSTSWFGARADPRQSKQSQPSNHGGSESLEETQHAIDATESKNKSDTASNSWIGAATASKNKNHSDEDENSESEAEDSDQSESDVSKEKEIATPEASGWFDVKKSSDQEDSSQEDSPFQPPDVESKDESLKSVDKNNSWFGAVPMVDTDDTKSVTSWLGLSTHGVTPDPVAEEDTGDKKTKTKAAQAQTSKWFSISSSQREEGACDQSSVDQPNNVDDDKEENVADDAKKEKSEKSGGWFGVSASQHASAAKTPMKEEAVSDEKEDKSSWFGLASSQHAPGPKVTSDLEATDPAEQNKNEEIDASAAGWFGLGASGHASSVKNIASDSEHESRPMGLLGKTSSTQSKLAEKDTDEQRQSGDEKGATGWLGLGSSADRKTPKKKASENIAEDTASERARLGPSSHSRHSASSISENNDGSTHSKRRGNLASKTSKSKGQTSQVADGNKNSMREMNESINSFFANEDDSFCNDSTTNDGENENCDIPDDSSFSDEEGIVGGSTNIIQGKPVTTASSSKMVQPDLSHISEESSSRTKVLESSAAEIEDHATASTLQISKTKYNKYSFLAIAQALVQKNPPQETPYRRLAIATALGVKTEEEIEASRPAPPPIPAKQRNYDNLAKARALIMQQVAVEHEAQVHKPVSTQTAKPGPNVPAVHVVSETNVESDQDEDSEDMEESESVRDGQIVVKEAPLLRLENVTNSTRNNIPEKQDDEKKGRWRKWFNKNNVENAKDEEPSEEASDEERSEFSEADPSLSTGVVETFPIVEAKQAHGSGSQPSKNIHPVPMSPSRNKASVKVQPQWSPLRRRNVIPPTLLSKKAEVAIGPPTKQKKKKGAPSIGALLEKTTPRKVGRHGDEVSVGTMNYTAKKRFPGQSAFVPPTNSFLEDPTPSVCSRRRPWDAALKKGPKRFTSINKRSPWSSTEAFGDEDEDELKKVDILGKTDDFYGNSNNDSSNHLPALAEDMDESEESPEISDDEDDEIAVPEMSDMERLVSIDDAAELDFDDLWKNEECDIEIAMEFERTKRKKNHARSKKRQRREKEREERANAMRRLPLFERKKEAALGKKKSNPSKLSEEFVDAIHKVFDEGSVNSADSNSDSDKSDVDMFDDMSGGGSCRSLYVEEEPEEEEEVSEGAASTEEQSQKKTKKGSDSVSKASRRSKTSQDGESKTARSRSSSHSTKSAFKAPKRKRSKKTEVDASDHFMREIAKLEGPKVLTIQNLRQEMIDRRGTSVNLLKKEYVNFRKKRNERQTSEREKVDDDTKSVDFGVLKLGIYRTPSNDKFGGDATSVEDKSDGDGLAAKLSRWASTEGISDLDDLATVNEVPTVTTNMFGVSNGNGGSNGNGKIGNSQSEAPATPVTDSKTMSGMGSSGMYSGQYSSNKTPSRKSDKGKSTRRESSGSRPSNRVSRVSEPGLPDAELPYTSERNNDGLVFDATFADMPLGSIQENEDDDADFGLLARHEKSGGDSDDESAHSGRFKNKKTSKSKPKFGQKMKKFVPKMPKQKGRGNGGFMLND